MLQIMTKMSNNSKDSDRLVMPHASRIVRIVGHPPYLGYFFGGSVKALVQKYSYESDGFFSIRLFSTKSTRIIKLEVTSKCAL